MKAVAFIVVSLLATYSQARMGDFESRITCPTGMASEVVKELAASSKQDTFGKGILKSAAVLKAELKSLVNDKAARTRSTALEVQNRVTQAVCLQEYLQKLDIQIPADVYADNLELITLTMRINARNSSLISHTQEQKNVAAIEGIIESNKATLAFIFSAVD